MRFMDAFQHTYDVFATRLLDAAPDELVRDRNYENGGARRRPRRRIYRRCRRQFPGHGLTDPNSKPMTRVKKFWLILTATCRYEKTLSTRNKVTALLSMHRFWLI